MRWCYLNSAFFLPCLVAVLAACEATSYGSGTPFQIRTYEDLRSRATSSVAGRKIAEDHCAQHSKIAVYDRRDYEPLFGHHTVYLCKTSDEIKAVNDRDKPKNTNPLPAATQSDADKTPTNLKTAKTQCAELGFKTGTEKFGECVLKLSE